MIIVRDLEFSLIISRVPLIGIYDGWERRFGPRTRMDYCKWQRFTPYLEDATGRSSNQCPGKSKASEFSVVISMRP